jgi:branched-chain amino acid transport system substrate-binding protein
MNADFRVLLTAGLVFLVGCGGPAEPVPIWVGHLAPLSGPHKNRGESARRGILLAVDEANRDTETRIAGRPIYVRHANTHGDPDAFGAEATRLVAVNRVVALLGGMQAADIKEFRRLNRPGLCLISPVGRPPESQGGGKVFFTGLSPSQKAGALARFAADRGFNHVALLVDDDDPFGEHRAAAEAFREQFPAAWQKKHRKGQAQVTGPKRYGRENPLENRAKALGREMATAGKPSRSKPQAILLAGKPEALPILRATAGLAHMPVLFAGEEAALPDFLEEPKTNQDIYFATAFAPDAGTERVREFVKRYGKRFGERPDGDAALAYDDARILFAALRQVAATGGNLEQALAATKDFAGLTGPLSIDKNGQAQRPRFIVGIQAGKPRMVKRYPAE